MNWITERLSESSTWAGLATIAVAVGQAFPALAYLATPLAGIFGVIAAARKG